MEIDYTNQTVIEVDGKKCPVYEFVVKITDHKSYAKKMIHTVCDDSWIAALDTIPQAAYEKTVERTSEKLKEIFSRQAFDSQLKDDFGEYMISISSIMCLVERLSHKEVPLAELWKEKVTGNPGFDFHTISPEIIFSFGEAKYRSSSNAYTDAAEQICDFIDLAKDRIELSNLQNFSLEAALKLANEKIRSFTVAFSMHSDNYGTIFNNAIGNEFIKKISTHAHELYLIGVKHA
jgi:hypothetical protein